MRHYEKIGISVELTNKTMKAVRWNFVSTVIAALVALLQLWILSRVLSPHEYGIISLALMIIQLLNIFLDFGLSNSIVRRSHISEIELSSLYSINILMGLLTFIVAYFSASGVAAFFKSPELAMQIKIMAFGFLFSPFAQQQRAIMAREMKFNFIAKVAIATLLVNFIVVIVLAFLYRQAWVASVAFLSSTAVSSVIFFHRGLSERRLSFAFDWSAAQPHLRYAVQLVSDSLVNVISLNTYPALMARLVDLTAIGGYNIAWGISVSVVDRLKPVLMQSLFPAFSKFQDDDIKLAKNFLLVTTYASLINFPILAGLLVASSELIKVLFRPEWHFIVDLVQILCLVGFFRSVDAPVITLLLVKAKMYLNVRFGIAKLIVGVILAWGLGTKYGISGIAVSFLIVQALNTILGYFFLIRPCLSGLGLNYLKATFIPVAQILPILIFSGPIAVLSPSSNPAVNLILVIVVGVVSYTVGLILTPFPIVRDFLFLAGKNCSPKFELYLKRKLYG